MSNRRHKTKKALRNFFKYTSMPDFGFVPNDVNIGIAISGGGYRSMLTAAGVLSAFDIRTEGSHKYLGGLLQSTNYIVGISGGSWLVMSNVVNNFKPMIYLRDNEFNSILERLLPGVPDFNPGYKPKPLEDSNKGMLGYLLDLIKGTSNDVKQPMSLMDTFNDSSTYVDKSINLENFNIDKIFKFYTQIHQEVQRKKNAGFFVSFTDYWGLALSKRLFTADDDKESPHTFTAAFKELSSFKEFNQPFPIITAIQKTSPSIRLFRDESKSSHIVEFNPFEFGSWDSYINGFFKLKYLGTLVFNGIPQNECKCGYDNIGFLAATSSSLFNNVFMVIYRRMAKIEAKTRSNIETILGYFGIGNTTDNSLPKSHPDYAIYSPNPFYEYTKAETDIQNSEHLYLVDGGDDGQNIPFHPLLQPCRNVDTILSYDLSSDKFNFPNGSSLVKTQNRYHNTNSSFPLPYFDLDTKTRAVFPFVPDPGYLKNGGSIFLGCDLIYDYPLIDPSYSPNPFPNYLPPLIVYTPNTEISYPSNTSTFKLSYQRQEITAMFENGYNLATNANSSDFASCIRCAVIKRQFDKIKLDRAEYHKNFDIPEFCQKCYIRYCYHRGIMSDTDDRH